MVEQVFVRRAACPHQGEGLNFIYCKYRPTNIILRENSAGKAAVRRGAE